MEIGRNRKEISIFLQHFLFGVVLIFLLGFYFCICYFQMPKGDDLLTPYYMGFLHYVDGQEWKPMERVETIHQAIEQYISYYLQFNGRITALLQGFIMNKVGWIGTSIISSIVYVLTIMLVARIGLGSWGAIVKAPGWLVLISLYMYELTATGSYIEMWTFVCQYAIPTLLYLLYYFLIMKYYKSDRKEAWKMISVTVMGFFTGACHECLGAFCLLLVGLKTIFFLYNKEISFRNVWINIGLLIGYIFTFFAPGNFKRLVSSHDSNRLSIGIIEKLKISLEAHYLAFGGVNRTILLLISVVFIFLVFSYKKTKQNIFIWIKENVEIIVTLFVSIFVWAVFAPPVPHYGLQLWKALLIILILRGIRIDIFTDNIWKYLTVVVVCIWINFNYGWMSDLVNVTVERREQIEQAVENKEEVVFVDKYPDTMNQFLTLYNIANQDIYNNECGNKYYRIKVMINN